MQNSGSPVAHRKRGKAGRTTETLLGSAEGDIDPPIVNVQGNPAQGCYAIDKKKRPVPVDYFADPLERLKGARRGFRVDQSEYFGIAVFLERGLYLFRRKYLAPRFFDPFYSGAIQPCHLAHPVAEIAVAADHNRIARLHKIAERGFHAGAPRPRLRRGQGISGREDLPEA